MCFAVAGRESIVAVEAGALLANEIRVEGHGNAGDFTSGAAVLHEVGALADA